MPWSFKAKMLVAMVNFMVQLSSPLFLESLMPVSRTAFLTFHSPQLVVSGMGESPLQLYSLENRAWS